MRKEFADELYKQMEQNSNVWLLVGDLGYGIFDKIEKDFPQRFVNCGASETAMLCIAVGLAIQGKIPFVYSITNFLIRRPYEAIKLYLDGEKLPVKLVGSGRDREYSHDGPSHDATDTMPLLETLPNIKQYWPEEVNAIPVTVALMVQNDKPCFISLKR